MRLARAALDLTAITLGLWGAVRLLVALIYGTSL